MKDGLKTWLIALFVSLLIWFPRLRVYTIASNRYHAFWGMVDALAFIAIIVAVATVLAFIYGLAQRFGSLGVRRTADAVFVVTAGYAAVACLVTSPVPAAWALWKPVCAGLTVLATILAAAVLLDRRRVVVRFFRAGVLILSPAVAFVFLLLLSYPDFSVPNEPISALVNPTVGDHVTAQNHNRRVHLFIFDEWSYSRTVGSPELAVEFPHLHELTQTATVFRDAHSPHRSTIQSLPRLLCQTDDKYVYLDGKIGFDDRQLGFVAARNRANLFTGMDDLGFRTYLVGWYHPYRLMFGDELDVCRSAPSHLGNGNRFDFASALGRHLRWGISRSLAVLPKPEALQWRFMSVLGSDSLRHRVDMAAEIHGTALSLLQRAGEAQFAVFHYVIPHWPFVYRREGYDSSIRRKPPYFHSEESGKIYANESHYISGYKNNLRYMDTLLGELTGAMKSAGTFDDALLIFTSDHNWRADPALQENPPPRVFTHVPLVVKYPGQRERVDLFETFELTDLKTRVILPALRGETTVATR